MVYCFTIGPEWGRAEENNRDQERENKSYICVKGVQYI